MFCHNCGAELRDNAKFCHECGTRVDLPSAQTPAEVKQVKVRISDNGVLTVTRRSNLWRADIPVDIYIDNTAERSIQNGETVEFILPAGSHAVDLILLGENIGSYLSDILPGGSDEISFEVSPPASREELVSRKRPLQNQGTRSFVEPGNSYRALQTCPRCGGPVLMQTVTESRKAGCFTILLYFLLAITLIGILVIIPLALRKKTETVTYAVCQSCGQKRLVSRR